ncbi:MAG: hypothetical protein HY847_12135 [Betaproteobacteria bacterium]|nr:hypothetical protein [Betaproteobacteria bacterium]
MRFELAALLLAGALGATLHVGATESRVVSSAKFARTALFDMTYCGETLVAVGERGVVMRSDDGGKNWQPQKTPTTRTLTSIISLGEASAIAAGHGGTILRTEDRGRTWTKVDVADVGKDAILGVTLLKSGVVLAYGAFGLYMSSNDEGKTWTRGQIINKEFDRHISKVVEVGDSLLLVGESGTVAWSEDQGISWRQSPSPYEGSFFGALVPKEGIPTCFW